MELEHLVAEVRWLGMLVEPKLICRDMDATVDVHYVLAYKFNPKLAEIFKKYVSMTPKTEIPRTLVMWVNEFDGARILVVHEYEKKSFEEQIVDWLYNLRDYYVAQKNRLKHAQELLSAVIRSSSTQEARDVQRHKRAP